MSELSRREFAEAIAFVSLVPFLGDRARLTGLPTLEPGASVEDPTSLAKALADAIRAQYDDRLSDADVDAIIRQIQATLERAAKVRKVPLTNGDEPDFVFSPVRAPGVG